MRKNFWIDEEFLKKAFVITSEANGAAANHSDRELVDNTFRIRPAINVIAEINFNGSLDRAPLNVRINSIDDVGEEIGATVDIADGIHPDARRQGAKGRRTHLQVPRVEFRASGGRPTGRRQHEIAMQDLEKNQFDQAKDCHPSDDIRKDEYIPEPSIRAIVRRW